MKRLFKLFILLSTLTLLITGCNKKEIEEPELRKINIYDYIQIEDIGYDSYGTIETSVDYEKLFKAISINASEQVKESGVDVVKYSIDYCNKNEVIALVWDESQKFKNGDVVPMHYRVNNLEEIEKLYDVEFIMDPFDYKVSNLKKLVEYNPFDDLVINSKNTMNGFGAEFFSIEHYDSDLSWKWKVEHSGTNGTLSNGDVLSLTIINLPDIDEFAQEHGIKITTNQREYKVNNLKEYITDSFDFNCVGEDIIAAANEILQSWVIDGLNDENQGNFQRTYELVNKILLINNLNNGSNKNKLFLIYKITDENIADGYYIYVSPQIEWVLDTEFNKIIPANNDEISNSFIYYDKETVRWSERFGWGQGYETQGFLRNGIPYAGHETLEEEILYIQTLYETEYDTLLIETPIN